MPLVIEAEPMFPVDLVDLLQTGGFSVKDCVCGIEAIDWIQSATQLQGLVTDIRVVERPLGWVIALQARGNYQPTRYLRYR
jgi:hypothetical protein